MANRIILILFLLLGCSEDEDMRLFVSSLNNSGETPIPPIEYYGYPSPIHSLALGEIPADNIINLPHDPTFNYLRDYLLAITDSSVNNTYQINIANGFYDGIDYQVPDFVMLVGESKAGVIINGDGNSTWVADADYPFTDEIGKPINTINQAYTHTFWVYTNSVVKNCTITGTRIKYNSHQDTGSSVGTHSIYSNVHFIKIEAANTSAYYYNIGCGGKGDDIMSWWDCTYELDSPRVFDNTTKNSGVFWHNTANRTALSVAEVINGHAINQGGVIITQQNSTQPDLVIVNGYTVEGYITWGAIWNQLNTNPTVQFEISNTDLPYTEY